MDGEELEEGHMSFLPWRCLFLVDHGDGEL